MGKKTGSWPKAGPTTRHRQGTSLSCVIGRLWARKTCGWRCGVRLFVSLVRFLRGGQWPISTIPGTHVVARGPTNMVSQDQLDLNWASTWTTGLHTRTSVLCTCLLAVAALLAYILTRKTDPPIPYTVTVPPQLANDYQWDVKGKKTHADSPEVCVLIAPVVFEHKH